MHLHVEALFTQDASGRLVAVNQPHGGMAPRFFLGRTPEGNVWCLRQDIDEGGSPEAPKPPRTSRRTVLTH